MTEISNARPRNRYGFKGPRTACVAKQRIMPIAYLRLIGEGRERGEERRFSDMMRERLGEDAHIVPVGRARSGIYLLTKRAVRGRRRKVLMSPFTIPDVVTMVMLADGEPVFFDFEPDSTACDIKQFKRLIDDQTACVLVTHQHVNEARLAEIARICSSHGSYLFDDCAIAFGGEIDGRPLGTLTDASVFSFSSFKLLNFFWGGMVTTRNTDIAQFLQDAVENWPRLSTRDYLAPAMACLKYDLASRPLLFKTIIFPMLQHRTRRLGAPQSLENMRFETTSLDSSLTSRPSFTAFAEWTSKLRHVNNWLSHRRATARVYQRLLGDRMVSARSSGAVFDGSCFVNFPVVVPECRTQEICREMLFSGFDVGRSLYPNVHGYRKFAHLAGVSSNVDRLTRSSIYLPTHFGVSAEYAEAAALRLVDCLRATDRNP